jgi:hypothetical protein
MGKETRVITKLFHKAGIKVAYTTKHTLRNLLSQHPHRPNQYDSSGVYQLTAFTFTGWIAGNFMLGKQVNLSTPGLKNTKRLPYEPPKVPVCEAPY